MRAVFRVGDLKKAIRESAAEKGEFKPVYGNGVQDDNKRINGQAYSDIEKETSSYDGGVKDKDGGKKGTSITHSVNKGMSDIEYDSVSKPFKERAAAQTKGFPSADAENIHKDERLGNADYGTDEYVYDLKKHAEGMKTAKDKLRSTGLTGGTQDKSDVENRTDTMFESRKIKNIKFRRTEFLSEGHMLSKVPDDFKNDGSKFIMSDSAGNSYLVEWHCDGAPDVEKRVNKNLVNEEIKRIKNLYNYHSKDYFNTTNANSRVRENREFSDMIGKARKLMK